MRRTLVVMDGWREGGRDGGIWISGGRDRAQLDATPCTGRLEADLHPGSSSLRPSLRRHRSLMAPVCCAPLIPYQGGVYAPGFQPTSPSCTNDSSIRYRYYSLRPSLICHPPRPWLRRSAPQARGPTRSPAPAPSWAAPASRSRCSGAAAAEPPAATRPAGLPTCEQLQQQQLEQQRRQQQQQQRRQRIGTDDPRVDGLAGPL
jgi:hypothetical protein